MKKILSLLLCASMIFCLAACSNGAKTEDKIDIAISDWITGTSEDPGGAMTISSAKESLNPLTGKNDLANESSSYENLELTSTWLKFRRF